MPEPIPSLASSTPFPQNCGVDANPRRSIEEWETFGGGMGYSSPFTPPPSLLFLPPCWIHHALFQHGCTSGEGRRIGWLLESTSV